ncbi:lipopolysaccharide biosynthesis protein, partial [Arachidicoccus sp.]|uniref:lipopolysaccharide biosynthesis protein n=1 Tax=Arachidicoccus sp. TaxID=1872624 RepID=UPI003D1D085C
YLILFFSAPLIADFYSMPKLIPLTRVLTLNIIIYSFALVQNTRLIIKLDFRTLAKVNIAGVLISGVFAIIIAYLGYGVWALVWQSLISSFTIVAFLWGFSRWKPSLKFSKQSFKQLFSFGSKLLGASIIATVFDNIYKICIGKYYAASELGYFTQAKQYTDSASVTVTDILNRVTFPILSSIQDDDKRLVSVYRKMLRMTSFIIFPIMTCLAILANPLVRFLLTDKWLPIVPLFQLLCFARIVYPISALNNTILNVKGRSDLFLKLDIVHAVIAFIVLFFTLSVGIHAVVTGQLFCAIIYFFVDAYLPGKLFHFGVFRQFKELSKIMVATIAMSVITYYSLILFSSPIAKLIVGGGTGIISYFAISYFLKIEEIQEFKNLLKRKN